MTVFVPLQVEMELVCPCARVPGYLAWVLEMQLHLLRTFPVAIAFQQSGAMLMIEAGRQHRTNAQIVAQQIF